MLWRVRGRLVPLANNFVGTQSCPTPPRHSSVRPDPTNPWYVWVSDSTGFEWQTFSGKDEFLETFVNPWDAVMPT